jgi:hypothetical protein
MPYLLDVQRWSAARAPRGTHGASEEVTMQRINLNISGMDIDYRQATAIAHSVAEMVEAEPTVVAWHDGPRKLMSPEIAGADITNRWRDYGESHGGNLTVSVNGDYDFIFADTNGFDQAEPSPYLSVTDEAGHEFLCLAEHLKDKANPQEDGCVRLDRRGDQYSSLHEG